MLTKTLVEWPAPQSSSSDRLYLVLAETSPEALLLVAPDGKIRLGNNHAAKLHGFLRAQEMFCVKFSSLVVKEEHHLIRQSLARAIKYGSSKKLEHDLLRVDGTSFPAELDICVVRSEVRELEAFVVIIRDVTERKRMEARLKHLSEEVRNAREELTHAYETTLEGWAGVLDLRDKETEGHSRRVTDATVKLALTMGITEEELTHIRRGALLHDIGKIGIPDGILLKPGSLTEEEWEIMRMHPVYAHELLSPIQFLEEASVIPHCHHERWDGTGYPRGLKGEEIPLAARIFTVVDVWEALRSNRPYRPAWPERAVRDYIRSKSGAHFDPQVVEAFLQMDTSVFRRQQTMPLEVMMEIIERAHARDTLTRLTDKLI